MRSRMLAVLFLVACCSVSSFAQTVLLKSPGFETGVSEWTCHPYWSGTLAAANDAAQVRSGKAAALLSATANGGRVWARMHSPQLEVSYGLHYRYSAWVRGKGALKLGAINYAQRTESKTDYLYQWQLQPVALSDQWQQVSLLVDPLDPDVQRVALTIEVEGDGALACVDDVAFEVAREAAGAVKAPGYLMVPAGTKVQVPVTVLRDSGQPWPAAKITAVLAQPPARQTVLQLDEKGQATYGFDGAAQPALIRLVFAQPEIGAAATTYVDVVDQPTFDIFAAAAGRAKPGALPCHLLFLGDSLTDFLRGYNYTDQVGFWLNQTNGGRVTYRNAGVGGDYISRVWQRLKEDPAVYRKEAYQDLYSPRPQRIFIMLGHNDCKLSSSSGFTAPVVPVEQFRSEYDQVLAKLKQDTGARITVLSSTSSLFEITKATADKAVAAGKSCNLFGKPEVLEQFNALTKEVATKQGCEYLDVYEPTRTYADKPSLFTGDGVHMTLAGNHLLALEILRYLGR